MMLLGQERPSMRIIFLMCVCGGGGKEGLREGKDGIGELNKSSFQGCWEAQSGCCELKRQGKEKILNRHRSGCLLLFGEQRNRAGAKGINEVEGWILNYNKHCVCS